MKTSRNINQFLANCAKADFVSVNNLIATSWQLDNNVASYVIVESGRCFYKCDQTLEVSSENLKALLTILSTCSLHIENIQDDGQLNVLRSLFYIVKFIITKEHYDALLQLRDVFLSNVIDTYSSPGVLQAYSLLCHQIYNLISKFDTARRKDVLYQELVKLSLEMNAHYIPTRDTLITVACSYFKTTNFCESDWDFRYDCFCLILKLLAQRTKSAEDVSYIFCAVIKMVEIFVLISLKQGETHKIMSLLRIALIATVDDYWTPHHFELLATSCTLCDVMIQMLVGSNEDLLSHFFDHYLTIVENITELEFKMEIQSTCKMANTIMYSWIECCSRYELFKWEERNLLEIFDFLERIGRVAIKTDIKCSFSLCSKCDIRKDYYTAISITSLTGSLLKISFNKIDVSQSLLTNVFKCMETCCEYVQKLIDARCLKWKTLWNDVGSHIYNLAVKLYSFKNAECYEYFILFLMHLLKFENIDESNPSTIFKLPMICSTLDCLSELGIQKKQCKSSFIFAALKILLCSETKAVYKQWIRVKSKSKEYCKNQHDEKCQRLSIVCVLEHNKEAIKEFYPSFNGTLDNLLVVKLLQNELDQYKLLWPSKIPMASAMIKLSQVADLLHVVKSLIKTWGPPNVAVHEDVWKLVDSVTDDFEKFENIDDIEKQIYLASLYVFQYLIRDRESQTETINYMSSTDNLEEGTEILKDHNEKCDLVSAYPSLQMDTYDKMMQLLEKAISSLATCLSAPLLPATIKIIEEYNVLTLIMKIADEFQIHRYSLQTVSACFLCFRLSRLLNNDVFIIISVSMLLEEPIINSTSISEILQESDRIVSKLRDTDSECRLEILITYHISKSKMYLRNKQLVMGHKEYEMACELLERSKEEIGELAKIKLQALHVKFLELPCHFKMKGHDVNYLENLSRLYYDISAFYKPQEVKEPTITSLMFNVNQDLVEKYCCMMLPREVRCYGRSIITLAQQLVIPTRTAYFLTTLAQADLQSCRVHDCEAKLRGLGNILCLKDNFDMLQCCAATKNDSDFIESFKDMALDPQDVIVNKKSGTPITLTDAFKLVSFVKHPLECSCFFCTNIEYHNLVIRYVSLVAQLNGHTGNEKTAKFWFVQGMDYYKHIILKTRQMPLQIKLYEKSNYCTVDHFEDLLNDAFCTLLLHFGNFLIKLNNFRLAIIINEKLLELVARNNNFLLKNQAQFQKMAIVMSRYEKILTKKNIQKRHLLKVNDEKTEVIKTPENKQSSLVIETCPQLITPPKRKLIKVKCDFTEVDKSCDKLKVQNKENSKFEHIRTPTRKKEELVSESEKQSAIPSAINKEHSPVKHQDFSFVVPISPTAYTPNAAKAASALNSKTKLLTRKLKSSSKKCQSKQNTESTKSDGVKANNKRVSSRIRKNLASEMSAADDEVSFPVKKDTAHEKDAQPKRVTRSQNKTKNANKLNE